MNQFTAIAVFVVVLALTACNSGMGEGGNVQPGVKTEKIDRSQRTMIDSAKYIDFTVSANDAFKITKQDVMYALNGVYSLKGSNSYITIDRKDGTIALSSDDAWYNNEGGHNMYAKFVFGVSAANENCLYLKKDNKEEAQLVIDSESFVNQAVPDLLVCLPLYGFSQNRIEVSPIMDGYILMPPGTYWARKK